MTARNDSQPTTSLKTAPLTLLAPTALAQIDNQLAALVARLPQLDDDQLLDLTLQAQRLEACAFRLRGACVAELRRRTARLVGGRGQRDTAGVGVKAKLAQLASQLNVSVSTLKTDARIHETFFADVTGPACGPALPRDFYVTALGAPDPLAAINTARERSADPTYNRAQFRRDVLALRSATPTTTAPLLPGVTPPTAANLRVPILPVARPALTALMRRDGQSPAAIVAAALVAYHEALTTPARRRRSAAKATPRLTQPPLPLSR